MTETRWDLLGLDAAPGSATLSSLAVGDLGSDGQQEIVTGGEGALLWYRPDTFEKGVIAEGQFHVSVALDLDGDGRLEVACAKLIPEPHRWTLVWFKPNDSIYRHLWTAEVT